MDARERRGRQKHLKGRNTHQNTQTTMEQPLKRELLRECPHRVQRQQDQHRWLPQGAALSSGDGHQPRSHEKRTQAHRYEPRCEIVATKTEFVPRMRAAYDDVEDVCAQDEPGGKK